MPTTTEIIVLLIQSAIIIAGIYFTTYIKENAKNKSQSEYLGKLTAIVEEVKQGYAKDIELLKSNLALFTSKQNILFTEGKDAIIEFFSDANKWLWHIMKISVHDYNISNYLDIDNLVLTMTNNYHETNLCFGKIQLLVDDMNLITTANETIIEIMKAHNYVELILGELKRTIASEKSLADTMLTPDNKFQNMSQEFKDYFLNRAKDNSKVLDRIRNEFLTKKADLLKVAMEKRNQYRDLAKEYLKK